ncbi:hypothetical protein A2415_02095 [candidate division WWE3 bacterium RIFOXYC1_FULL_39_7]|uniref:Type II secretion system protein GspG C-terminal domain-containing protein n=2 Tax=Katanobacteria TaxID=422282 RepID=A0A1F4X8W4_UNCKA|nr:MAG: hypothetical protein A2415_02095 [candidate division WWE3 bacterium RIFOXYC1_FULL_39_7]OGC78108.1 MAG: hypothetical protein A2619_05135 [candidate division WWE3 bacterium RIFOXYD1_FULL_39_9]
MKKDKEHSMHHLTSFPSVKTNNNVAGFTMIELLVVGMVMAILAGTLSSVINYQRHRINSDDAVRRATLLKLVNVIETYHTSENRFPADPDSNGNPTDDPVLGTYLVDDWPDNLPFGAIYTYWVNAARNIAGITVNTNAGNFYKFRSTTGDIRECAAPATPADDVCN